MRPTWQLAERRAVHDSVRAVRIAGLYEALAKVENRQGRAVTLLLEELQFADAAEMLEGSLPRETVFMRHHVGGRAHVDMHHRPFDSPTLTRAASSNGPAATFDHPTAATSDRRRAATSGSRGEIHIVGAAGYDQ